MPNLAYPIILGKPWLEKNNVVYLAKRRCLRIGSRSQGIVVRASNWYEEQAPAQIQNRVSHLCSYNTSIVLCQEFKNFKACKNDFPKTIFGAISIHDINRALEPKRMTNCDDVRKTLPIEIQHHTDLFMDDDIRADELMSPYPRVDLELTQKLL